jgi:hypothetical protein
MYFIRDNVYGNFLGVAKWKSVLNIGCSFKCILKVDVEDSIVNAPYVSLHTNITNNAKSEVRFKQLIPDL